MSTQKQMLLKEIEALETLKSCLHDVFNHSGDGVRHYDNLSEYEQALVLVQVGMIDQYKSTLMMRIVKCEKGKGK